MAKIYIVTSGEYSDYTIDAVFSTKEKAEEYVQQYGTNYRVEDYDIDEEINECLIPKITIQPLVENALYHGIKNKRGKGKISIKGKKTDDGANISISDDGLGITADRLRVVMNNINNRSDSEKTTYGLYNVNERIRLNFGEKYGIKIESEYGMGTTVQILLPINE